MVTKEGTIDRGVEKSQEERVDVNHISDSLTLLLYLGLLILTVLTLWLFKHRRFRYIHETGLAIIYGLIVGAIIRYGSNPRETSVRSFSIIGGLSELLGNGTRDPEDSLPPEKVLVSMLELAGGANKTRVYEYDYSKRLLNHNANAPILTDKATFNPEVFFNVILPPIIFCAGYSMKRKHFFRNIGAILTLAFIGTTISCVVVGSVVYGITRLSKTMSGSVLFNDCLLFGALISATDPVTVLAIFNDLNVDVDVYALVFGESVLNDAVAIVLSQAIEKYGSLSAAGAGFQGGAIVSAMLSFLGIFFAALGIGTAMGCLTAIITKFTRVRDYPMLECSLFILMSYSTFLAAEVAGSTGIVAVLFCGICQAHYTYNNLSREAKGATKSFFEMLNFLAENFTFVYIGVTTFTFSAHAWDPMFIVAAFVAILLGRALNVYPLCWLLNIGRKSRIGWNKMHMLMFSGLRGAIAFALAIRNTSSDTRKMIFSTTLVIVIATVLLGGGLASQMLQWLKISVGVEPETGKENPGVMATNENSDILSMDSYSLVQQFPEDAGNADDSDQTAVVGGRPSRCPGDHSHNGWLAKSWHLLDVRFLKPLLTHARPLLTETCPVVCQPLARLLTTEEQLTQASVQRDLLTDPLDNECPIVTLEPGHGFHDNEEAALTPSGNAATAVYGNMV